VSFPRVTSVHERERKREKERERERKRERKKIGEETGKKTAPEAEGPVDEAGCSETVVATALHLFSEVFA